MAAVKVLPSRRVISLLLSREGLQFWSLILFTA